jgi:hypothetical protein
VKYNLLPAAIGDRRVGFLLLLLVAPVSTRVSSLPGYCFWLGILPPTGSEVTDSVTACDSLTGSEWKAPKDCRYGGPLGHEHNGGLHLASRISRDDQPAV